MAPQAQTSRVGFGAFEVDLRTGELQKHGHAIRLPDQAFQVLALLLERPGELVTRDELQQKLWPANTFVDFDVGLNSAIKKLRDALDDSAEHPHFIQTLPRRGYRFIAPVDYSGAVVGSAPPQPAAVPIAPAQPQTPESAVRPAGPSGSRRAWYWAGSLVVAGLLLAGWLGRDSLRPPTAEEGRLAPIRSIAVLPLENLTGDPAQEYFVDGMTDAIITDLAQISALRVISRTSAMHYKGAKKPLPEIGRELQVDAVLEGSVVRSGTRVRIDAQLVHAATDRHLWARSYERDLRDIVALQNDVAQAIAAQVAIQLTPEEKTRFAGRRPVNPAAYEAYLRGRYFWNQRNDEGLKKSLEYYQEALQADPNYAPAYAGISDTYSILGFGTMRSLPREVAGPKAKAAALRAIELDDNMAEGHAALGHILLDEGDVAGAEVEFRRALQLNPGYATAYHWYALSFMPLLQWQKFCENIRRAQELDPLNPNISRNVATCLLNTEGFDAAVAHLKKLLEFDPNRANVLASLADTYAYRGMTKEELATWQKAFVVSGHNPAYRLESASAYAASGNQREAFKILEEASRNPALSASVPRAYAQVYAVLGRREEAMQALLRAYQVNPQEMRMVKLDFRLYSLRSDPRYQDLLRRLKLPPDDASKLPKKS